MSITITGRQRELLYGIIVGRLPGIDDVWHAVAAEEWETAQRLGREFSDFLRLVDDLGWGEGRDETIQLTTPPDVLQRAIQVLKREALIEDDEQRDKRLEVAETQLDRADTVEACDGILEQLAEGPDPS
jgi:hypothetical protein